MNPKLFTPLKIAESTMANRIVVSPMCQYSAIDGAVSDWHTMHIGQFAVANPGLIMLEGTAVTPNGRITAHDLCLYNETQGNQLKRLVNFVRNHSHSLVGVQLFHSGRKGSQYRPWDSGTSYGEGSTVPISNGGWEVWSPSAIRYSNDLPMPQEMTKRDLDTVRRDFQNSAKLALEAGVDTVEIHYAHGYLLHCFLSELSNHRADEYGGSLENRMRFPLEVFNCVRDIWPNNQPLGARISASDFSSVEGAWRIEDAIVFAKELEQSGADYLDVSAGFLSPEQDLMSIYGPGFQVSLASEIKRSVNIPVFAVGVISGATQAEKVIKEGSADAVAIARGMLYDPRWPWHAAQALGADPVFPPQYERAFSYNYPDTFTQNSSLQ